MIYLLHGSDVLRSQEKLNEIVSEYREKHGDLSVHQFDAEEAEFEQFKSALDTGSLFSAKKLAVVKYFFESEWERDKFYGVLESAKDSPHNIIVLWDREVPDKDIKEAAKFCKKVQEFKILKQQTSEPSIFKLGNAFLNSPRHGLRLLLELLHYGHDEQRLFSYLAACARNRFAARHLGRFFEEDIKIKTGISKPKDSLLNIVLRE